MASFEKSMMINGTPDQIFDFVANIRNLPKYLPTTRHAEPQQGERVRVEGEADGNEYSSDGFLHTDRDNYTMEWGADEDYYKGNLRIKGNGDSRSDVTVKLMFKDNPPSGRGDGIKPEEVEEGLQKALESIQNHMTGTGGKEEPRTAHDGQ